MLLSWCAATELLLAAVQLPIGVLLGAAAERLCRSRHAHASLRNTALNLAVAHASVSLILGRPARSGPSARVDPGPLVAALARLLLLAAGTVVGAALQPVGLTGGIATGKSTAARLLGAPGDAAGDDETAAEDRRSAAAPIEFVLIDVDGIAHEILSPRHAGSVYDRVVAAFGDDVLAADAAGAESKHGRAPGRPAIDRRKLGDVVFRDARKRRRLNAITHPEITKLMLQRILYEGLHLGRFSREARARGPRRRVVCVDVPLLFEGGAPLRLLFGTVLVVACRPARQLERLLRRDPDLTREQCRQRIASQMPIDEKARRADVVLRNDGSVAALGREVARAKEDVARRVAGPRGLALCWAVLGAGALSLTRYHLN